MNQNSAAPIEKKSLKDLSTEQLANLSVKFFTSGEFVRAFRTGCECILRKPDNKMFQFRMSKIIPEVHFQAFNPDLKKAILICLANPDIEHQKFLRAWMSILENDPELENILKLVNLEDDDAFFTEIKDADINSPLTDPFFYEGIRLISFAMPKMEFFLRRVRFWLLQEITSDTAIDVLPFVCALAEHCFMNEFVFSQNDEETELIEKLKKQLLDTPDNPLKISCLGCYEPLYQLNTCDNILALQGTVSPAFDSLLNLQITNPLREQDLKKTIVSLKEIETETSQKVREMYEENPYPRWRSVTFNPNIKGDIEGDILIAGCGTCKATSQMAKRFPSANILAVDLSKSSIAYGMRQLEKTGVENVKFTHADILDLDQLDQKFDLIECSGVLHHMKDPVEGWKKLLGRLKEGGRMNIGLYSTVARKEIYEVRKFVKNLGFTADPDGIRALREHIFKLPFYHEYKKVQDFRDFYTLSECRDLVFHVQETTYTIPELENIFEELDLSFLMFILRSMSIRKIYKKRFPTDTTMDNLDNWEVFEKDNPEAFASMYQMLLCRKGEEHIRTKLIDSLITSQN